MFGYEMKGVDPFSIKATVNGIFKEFPQDIYVKDFIKANRDDDYFTTLAKMWVLIRIDEEKIEELRQQHSSKGESAILKRFYIGPFEPKAFLSEKLYEFANFVSLLTREDYFFYHDTFLLGSSWIISSEQIKNNLSGIIFAYNLMTCFPPEAMAGLSPLRWFHNDINILLDAFQKLETELTGNDCELFEYLSNLIYVSIRYAASNKAKLLLLVSVIELLLTYSPL